MKWGVLLLNAIRIASTFMNLLVEFRRANHYKKDIH